MLHIWKLLSAGFISCFSILCVGCMIFMVTFVHFVICKKKFILLIKIILEEVTLHSYENKTIPTRLCEDSLWTLSLKSDKIVFFTRDTM